MSERKKRKESAFKLNPDTPAAIDSPHDMARATILEDMGCVIHTPLPGFSFSPKPEGLTVEERFAFATGADTPNPLFDDLVFKEVDLVEHPAHYTRHPAGVEVIEITEHEGFCLGNAVKYLLRAGVKGGKDKYVEDLEKAKWYIDREIHRFRREGNLSGWRARLSCDS